MKKENERTPAQTGFRQVGRQLKINNSRYMYTIQTSKKDFYPTSHRSDRASKRTPPINHNFTFVKKALTLSLWTQILSYLHQAKIFTAARLRLLFRVLHFAHITTIINFSADDYVPLVVARVMFLATDFIAAGRRSLFSSLDNFLFNKELEKHCLEVAL